MEQLRFFLIGIVIFGGVFDLLTKRIPNWWTFPCICIGIICQVTVLGWIGFLYALLGVGIAFILYFPLYLLNIMGAGDVKLLMAIGAFTDYKFTIYVALAAILIGGIYALIETVFVGRFLPLAKSAYYFIRSISVKGMTVEDISIDKKRKFSFGISLAFATAVIIWMEQRGSL